MTNRSEKYQEIVFNASESEETQQILVSLDVDKNNLEKTVEATELYIDDEERGFLKDYLQELDSLRPWARKIKSEEESKIKQRTVKKINNLIQELENEINKASQEDKTLEQIAARLRDRKLTEEAEKIRAGLEQPERRIRRLVDKKNQTDEFLEKFETMRNNVGGSGSLESALDRRILAVELILENSHERDEDKIRLEVPPWEEDFEIEAIFVDPRQNKELNQMLDLAIDLAKLAKSQEVINPDMSKSVEAMHTHIDFARKLNDRMSPRSSYYNVFDHQPGNSRKVWINPGVTIYQEGRNLPVGSDRLILVDNRLFDEPEALLSVLIHELMHAYFEHKGNYSHRGIHEKAEAVLRTCIELDIDENDFVLEEIIGSKPINREKINEAYLFALASEGLFPE